MRIVRIAAATALLLAGVHPATGPRAAVHSSGNRYVCSELEGKFRTVVARDDRRQRDFLLFEAARKGCVEIVARLLDRGASIEVRNAIGNTPLAVAAAAGRRRVVALLLDRGADIDRPDLRGATPLLKAVKAGRRGVVRLLVRRGADVGRSDEKGVTPLAAAAFNGSDALVGLLLEAGAEPDPVDAFGQSPIVFAAARGFTAIVGRLLDAGVDPARRYGHDLTALMWAAGYTDDTPAAEGVATTRLLLERGAPLDARDDRGMTALMIAAERGHPRVVDLLLEAGADPTLRDRRGRTAADLVTDAGLRRRLEEAAAGTQSAAR